MKKNSTELSTKIITFAFIIPLLLQLALFVYQLTNKIFSIWNIIATGMMIGLFVNAVRMSKHDKNQSKPKDPDIVTGGSTINNSNQSAQKQSKKSIIIKVIAGVICIALSILFFNIHNNKSDGLILVNSTVISQDGETTIETEETDEGISQSESEHIDVIVEYEFNGETKQTRISGNTTSKIYVDELKIYVDQNGKFVSDYGRILVWKIEAIIFLCSAILLALITIFSLGVEFTAGLVFFFAGLAIFFLIGSPFIENIWFNDLSCFCSLFINIGIYMLLVGILNLIFIKKEEPETPQEPISKEESLSNLKKRLKLKYNKTTNESFKQENETLTKSLTCKNCGAPIPSTHKFCTHCGTKKD